MHVNRPKHTTAYWDWLRHQHVAELKNVCQCNVYLQDDNDNIVPTVDRGEYLCDPRTSC